MLRFDDLFRGNGDSDKIAENHWGSGQGISADLPQGDEKNPLKDFNWSQSKSDF
jgi:hypothetical protein